MEVGKENASMKEKSKESRNDKTLSVFVSGLLLVSCSLLNIVRLCRVKLHVSAIILRDLANKHFIRMVRYLKGTRDKGIFTNPKTDSLNVIAMQTSVDCVRSRTQRILNQYIHEQVLLFFYAGVPLFWCSKLQSQISISTVKAEYLALSHSAREIIPTQELL